MKPGAVSETHGLFSKFGLFGAITGGSVDISNGSLSGTRGIVGVGFGDSAGYQNCRASVLDCSPIMSNASSKGDHKFDTKYITSYDIETMANLFQND